VPLLDHYREYFTTPPSPADVESWRRRWPDANTALLLPPALLVIDPDSDAALGEATALGLPPAPCVATGKGSHYYYRRPADAPIARRTHWGETRTIDILAHGYVIAPPSRHALPGRLYRWRVGPEVHPLIDAPRWAVEALTEAPAPSATSPGAVSLPRSLPKVSIAALNVSDRIKRLIVEGHDARYPTRSESRFAVLQALIAAGHDDAAIAGVFFAPDHAIGEKPRKLGRAWFTRELGRARAKSDVMVL
jgi:hypothetical protein